MNTTFGDTTYEQQPLPFNAIAGEKTGNRNLRSKKSSSSGRSASHGIDKVISTFGGTIINDLNDELIEFNVT